MHTSTFDKLTSQYQIKNRHRISKQALLKNPLRTERFSELDIFRRQVDQGHVSVCHQPYTNKKKSVWIYRLTFLAFAFLFTVLGVTTMSVPSALTIGFFSLPTTLKGLVITLCTVLAVASFLVGVTIRTDREAVIHTLEHARRHLHTLYVRKKIQLGIMRFFTIFGPQRRHAKALHHMYHDVLHKMSEKKEDTLLLIARITSLPSVDSDHKELLFNQAIAELHEKLLAITQAFRHADVSID